ncbi:MAG: sugar ABC transporter ATP-binding protein [Aeromicrobium sp.]
MNVAASSTTTGHPGSNGAGDPVAVRGVSKSFGGNVALDDVSLTLRSGEIHVIAGENGSGKSTLLACLAGALSGDGGALVLDGAEHPWWKSVREAARNGIALVSQELTLVPEMSIAANVALALPRPARSWTLSPRSTLRAVAPVLERVGLDRIDARLPVAELPIHLQQLVEIARALSAGPRVLLLDEPTSSLERDEATAVLNLARQLTGDGMAVALITHRMRELTEFADRVTVLRDGHLISGDSPRGSWTAESITQEMVGRAIDVSQRASELAPSPVVLAVEDLRDRDGRVRGVDLEVRAGEIVGLAGLVGAGRTELLETLYGVRRRSGGTVSLAGTSLPGSIRDMMLAGVRLVPDDRLGKALVPGMTVSENLDLSWTPRAMLIRPRALRAEARRLVAAHRISTPSIDQTIRSLSGGNQQKAIFARQLKSAPRVLLLDEPTRGVDVGAKADVYELLRSSAADGACVLVASSELEELIQLCHRVYVMFEGQIVAEFGRHELDEERMAAAATGMAS